MLLIAALLAWRVKGAMLIGILATTALGVLTGLVRWKPQMYSFSDISATTLRLDLPAALGIGFLEIVFVFFFIDLFDNVGTLVAVGKKSAPVRRGQPHPAHQPHPALGRLGDDGRRRWRALRRW